MPLDPHDYKWQSSKALIFTVGAFTTLIGLSAHFWQIHKLKLKPEIYVWTTSVILFATFNSFINIFHVDPWTLKTSVSCNIIGRSAKACYYLSRLALWQFEINRVVFILKFIIEGTHFWSAIKYTRGIMVIIFAIAIFDLMTQHHDPPTDGLVSCWHHTKYYWVYIVLGSLDIFTSILLTGIFIIPLRDFVTPQCAPSYSTKRVKNVISRTVCLTSIGGITSVVRYSVDFFAVPHMRTFTIVIDNVLNVLAILFMFSGAKERKKIRKFFNGIFCIGKYMTQFLNS